MKTTWFYCICIIVAVNLIINHIKSKIQKKPPSPFLCLPVIGHLHLMNQPVVHNFAKLAERYGPVLSFRLGRQLAVLVSSSSAAEECFTRNDVVLCNRPSGTIIGRTLGYNFTTMKFAPYGPHWRNLRRVAKLEIMSSQRLDSLASLRADEVRLLIKRLYSKTKPALFSESSDNDFQVVDMKLQIFDTTFNFVTRMMFGKRYYNVEDEEAKRFRKMIRDTIELMNIEAIGVYVPYLSWLDWRTERRSNEFVKSREAILMELIEENRKELQLLQKGPSVDGTKQVKLILQMLLDLQQSDPKYYTDQIIIGIIVDLIEGGSDGSASAIEWLLSLLLNHPEVIKKAQEEIDKNVGYDRFVDESDLNNLPYLHCIIKETLRMYPINPVTPHEPSEDCVIAGYRIPRGTQVMVNLWAIQNDPENWDDPLSFRPERFEGVKGYKVGFKMTPFGAGRRSCPGEGLAIRLVGITIASLLQCFEWKRVDDQKLVDMTFAPTFNLQRDDPLLQARLRPRSAVANLLANL